MDSNSIYKSAAGERVIMDLYDNVLKNWPVPYETLTVPTRHGETFVISCGEKTGSPLVLLHGSVSNAVSWVGDVEQYSRNFRVLAVDIPGEPGKSASNRPSWEGPDFAEWMEDLLNGLGLEKVSIVGLSQGGWTGLKFAIYRPDRVAKLVLLTPGGIVPTRLSFILSAVAFTVLGRWGAERLNRMVFGRQAIHPDAVKFMNAIMTHFNARIGKEYIFSDDELARLTMPVLVLGGTEDVVRPVDLIVARMLKLVPQFQAEIIPEMGHALVNLAGKIIPFLGSPGKEGPRR
jgi:pimeloyl-ACP methyl ester carboxylesterase